MISQFSKIKGALLSLIAGSLIPFSLAPYNIWPLSILSLVLLLINLQNISARTAFFRGWLFGLGLYGVGASWVYVSINQYGNAPVPLAILLTSLFIAVLSLAFTASFSWCYVRFRISVLFGFPALWVLFEWLRSWLFTGFPWLQLGYAHTDTALAGLAPITGLYGISFASALCSSLLFLSLAKLLAHKNKQAVLILAWVLAPWGFGLALQQIEWANPNSTKLTVTLLQPNIPQNLKWQPQQQTKTLQWLKHETEQHLNSALIIWPENAIPLFHHQAINFVNNMEIVLKQNNATVISGIPWHSPAPQEPIIHNSIFAFGNGFGIYHKQKLVPFGEYVPLQQLLRGLINFFNLPMSNFRPGHTNQKPLYLTHNNTLIPVMPYICYEIVYPDFVRKSAKNSQIMVTISDDSWFGKSIGPHQHLQMARMRAQENARYLLRSTNTGITAIIDPKGQIQSTLTPFKSDSITGSISLQSQITIYGHTGSWPIIFIAFVLLWVKRVRTATPFNHPPKLPT